MNIRILVCLIAVSAIVTHCNKDSPAKSTYRGTVLHIADQSPIAGVEVKAMVPYSWGTNPPQYITHTNAQGAYALEIPRGSGPNYLYPMAFKKNDMVVCPLISWQRNLEPDTTYMDQASYLRFINKLNTPGKDTQWISAYFVYADNPPANYTGFWPAGDTLISDIDGASPFTDTLLARYSHRLFKEGGAVLSKVSPYTLVYKPVNLIAFDTTETILEK